MSNGGAAGRIGKRIIEILEGEGYVAVPKEIAGMLESVREKYEISASALHTLASSSDSQTRAFAEATVARLVSPDKATLFEDYRFRIRQLENRSVELRTVLSKLTDLVGQKKFMETVAVHERYEEFLTLEEVAVLEITIKEANRCLKETQ